MVPFRYLLDTSILSDLIKNPDGPAAKRLFAEGEQAVSTSIIVACELRYGVQKGVSSVLKERVEGLLERIPVLSLKAGADQFYGVIRAELERAGTPIGYNDCLIAAHARSLDLILVTGNVKEFSRVSGLQVENWLTS